MSGCHWPSIRSSRARSSIQSRQGPLTWIMIRRKVASGGMVNSTLPSVQSPGAGSGMRHEPLEPSSGVRAARLMAFGLASLFDLDSGAQAVGVADLQMS